MALQSASLGPRSNWRYGGLCLTLAVTWDSLPTYMILPLYGLAVTSLFVPMSAAPVVYGGTCFVNSVSEDCVETVNKVAPKFPEQHPITQNFPSTPSSTP